MLAVWTPQQELLSTDLASGDDLGRSVAIQGNRAVVGAPLDDDFGSSSGAVYVFERSGTVWSQAAKITPTVGHAGDQFGFSVALDGNTILVGAPLEDNGGTDRGSVYSFELESGSWVQKPTITHVVDSGGESATALDNDQFGWSVSLEGNTAVVGAPGDETFSPTITGGAAFVLTRVGSTWSIAQKLRAGDVATAGTATFGSSVDISGDTIAVGAPQANPGANGGAYVFVYNSSLPVPAYEQQQKYVSPETDPLGSDQFGGSVAVDGNTLVVGATGGDPVGGGTNAGAAFVYERVSATWPAAASASLHAPFTPPPNDATSGDGFGISVAIDGDTIVVGASGDDISSPDNAGAAYIFDRAGGWTFVDKLRATDPNSGAANDRFGISVATDGAAVISSAPFHDHGITPVAGAGTGAAYVYVNPNDAPTISVPGTQSVNEDSSLTISGGAITVNDVDAFGADLTVTLSTGDGLLTLATTSGLLFDAGDGTADASMTFRGTLIEINAAVNGLAFAPTANFFGPTSINISVNDNGNTGTGGPQTTNASVTVNVQPVNDAPSFDEDDDTVNEDSGGRTVAGWAALTSTGPANESGQTLTYFITGNTNPSLFAVLPSVSSSGDLTYTPAADANGFADITLYVKDSGGTSNGGDDTSDAVTFRININAVNDAPSFDPDDDTVDEDSGARTVVGWADPTSAGPADEVGQTLTYHIVENTNESLFAVLPSVDSSGTLSYTPATDANGFADITIYVQDNGGTSNGGINQSTAVTFQIVVTAVNDAPTFTAGGDDTVDEDAGAVIVAGWATDIAAGPADEAGQTLTFEVTGNTDAGLFAVAPSVDPITGDLSYTPAANANGFADITLVLRDDGGGDDESAPITFRINVTAVNDTPTAVGQMVSVAEDGGTSITLSGSDLETAAANLTFTITSLPTRGILSYAGSPVTVGQTFLGAPTLDYAVGIAENNAGQVDGFAFTVTDRGDPDNAPVDPAETSAAANVVINITAAVAPGTFSVVGGVLKISGNGGNDTISVTQSGGDLSVQINGTTTVIPAAGITSIHIWGRDGNDTITLNNTAINSVLHGGDGTDVITGSNGRDLIFGDNGADLVSGGGGHDVVVGGDGTDIAMGNAGNDILIGGKIAASLTEEMLRDISEQWAINHIGGEDPDDGTLDESVIDDTIDLLAGGSGSDWFIVGSPELIIDFRPGQGDEVTFA